jgi:hypothetical protein
MHTDVATRGETARTWRVRCVSANRVGPLRATPLPGPSPIVGRGGGQIWARENCFTAASDDGYGFSIPREFIDLLLGNWENGLSLDDPGVPSLGSEERGPEVFRLLKLLLPPGSG